MQRTRVAIEDKDKYVHVCVCVVLTTKQVHAAFKMEEFISVHSQSLKAQQKTGTREKFMTNGHPRSGHQK